MCSSDERSPRAAVARLDARGCFDAFDGVGFDDGDDDEAFVALDSVGFDDAAFDDAAFVALNGVGFDDADDACAALAGVGLMALVFVADLAAAIFFVGFLAGGLDLASCFAGALDFLDEEDFLRAGCLELRLAIVGGSIREGLLCEHALPGQPAR